MQLGDGVVKEDVIETSHSSNAEQTAFLELFAAFKALHSIALTFTHACMHTFTHRRRHLACKATASWIGSSQGEACP